MAKTPIPQPTANAKETSSGQKRRIRLLLVEDSQTDALLLSRALQRSGLEVSSERVDTAEDMQAALQNVGGA